VGGELLTSESQVDEKLKEMNATFLASLEGLGGVGGGGSRRRRAVSEHSSSSPSPSRGRRGIVVDPLFSSAAAPPMPMPLPLPLRSRGGSHLRPGSRSGSEGGGSGSAGGGTGSEEVMGRMSLEEDGRPVRGGS
jgi:autophagy-related protein 13